MLERAAENLGFVDHAGLQPRCSHAGFRDCRIIYSQMRSQEPLFLRESKVRRARPVGTAQLRDLVSEARDHCLLSMR